MKVLWLGALILILVAGVVLYAYYRPTLEVTWFGTTVTLSE
jgi:hypothetical protein